MAGGTGTIRFKTFQNLPPARDTAPRHTDADLVAIGSARPEFGEGLGVGQVFMKDVTAAWLYSVRDRVLSKITDPEYPIITVPGQGWLNGRIYVMTPQGEILGSNINEPHKWEALTNIFANAHPDIGTAITVYNNYVLAWGEESLQFFYDSGEPVGNPLRRADHAMKSIGCYNADGIVHMRDSVFFPGYDRSRSRGIYMVNGFEVRKVSTPYVDGILERSQAGFAAGSFTIANGREFYVVNTLCLNHSLVFDPEVDIWYHWGNKDPLLFRSDTSSNNYTAALDPITGRVRVDIGTDFAPLYFTGMPIDVIRCSDPAYVGETQIDVFQNPTTSFLLPTSTLTSTSGTLDFEVPYYFPASGSFPPLARSGWWAIHSITMFDREGVTSLNQSRGPAHIIANLDHALYTVDSAYFDDGLEPEETLLSAPTYSIATFKPFIPLRWRTNRLDNGTNIAKFLSRIEAIGDQVSGSLWCRYSDDDQETWSFFRQIDLSLTRPRAGRLGSYRRRTWEFLYISRKHFRLEGVEIFGWMGNKG